MITTFLRYTQRKGGGDPRRRVVQPLLFHVVSCARSFKPLRIPGINSKELIPPAYVACNGPVRQPIPTRFLAIMDCLKLPALFSYFLGLFLIGQPPFQSLEIIQLHYVPFLFSKKVEKTTLSRDHFFIGLRAPNIKSLLCKKLANSS